MFFLKKNNQLFKSNYLIIGTKFDINWQNGNSNRKYNREKEAG